MIKVKPALHSRIKGVCFGYSGIVEKLLFSEETFARGVSVLRETLSKKGIEVKNDELSKSLRSGQKEYDERCRTNNYRELKAEEIWTTFFLNRILQKNQQREAVEAISEKLSSIYEYYIYKRRPVKDIEEILRTLSSAGYAAVLICNTISRTLIPDRLRRFNIDRYLNATVLSIEVGKKKPAREIFERAFRETGLHASECMHVGDSVQEDVSGSKEAGFYRSVLLQSDLTQNKDRDYAGASVSSYTIESPKELFQIME